MNISAVDPYGNQIIIPTAVVTCGQIKGPRTGITDSPERTIQRPALIMTTCISDPRSCITQPCETHYLRMVNWDNSLLISARKQNGKWIAFRCMYNPPFEELKALYYATRQLE